MSTPKFQHQLQSIVAHAPLEVRDQFQQTIDQVTSYGIRSFEDLLAVVQDEAVDPDTRVAVCWLLGQFGKKRAVYALLRAFDSQQDNLRRQASHAIGLVGSKAAVKPLLIALRKGSTAEHRADAAYALGHIGDARAVEPLLRSLADPEEDARVRGQAAESLANLRARGPAVYAALISVLADASAEVRFWAAFALGEIANSREQEAIRALEHLAATDTAVVPGWWSVSREAEAALVQIKNRGDD